MYLHFVLYAFVLFPVFLVLLITVNELIHNKAYFKQLHTSITLIEELYISRKRSNNR